MKAKFVFLLFLMMLFQAKVSVSAMILKSKHQIILKEARDPAQGRSLPQFPIAFIDGSNLLVELPLNFDSATIVVRNVETGEETYSSVDLDSSTFMVELAGMYKGKYVLEVHLNGICFIGDFILEY